MELTNNIALPVISEKELEKYSHKDMSSFIRHYILKNQSTYNTSHSYTKDDTISLLSKKNKKIEKIFCYNQIAMGEFKTEILAMGEDDYIQCSDNFITYCTLYSVYKFLNKQKQKKKMVIPQKRINFLINGTPYTLMNFKYWLQGGSHYCIVSEEERSLTNNLNYNFFMFFDLSKIPYYYYPGESLTIIDEIDKNKKFKYLKLPYFLIDHRKNLSYPIIICEGSSLQTLEVTFYITVYYKNMFEEIEKFINVNKDFQEYPNFRILIIDLVYKINKHTLEDLEIMVMKMMIYFEQRYDFQIQFRASLVYPTTKSHFYEFKKEEYRYIPLYVQSGIGGSDKVMSIYLCKKSKTSCLRKLHNYILKNIFQCIGVINYFNVKRVPQFY